MTVSAHDHAEARHATHGTEPISRATASALPLWRRPWAAPVGMAGVVVLGLVAAGVIPFGLLLYALPLAGCGLMHVFMGHGGHGGHGNHDAQTSPTDDAATPTGSGRG